MCVTDDRTIFFKDTIFALIYDFPCSFLSSLSWIYKIKRSHFRQFMFHIAKILIYICAIKKHNIIATDRLHINKLKECFGDMHNFNTSDISNFYRSLEPDVKQATINWRVYHLVSKGVLERRGRGVYKIGRTTIFVPYLDNKTESIYKKILSEFPYSIVCVWDTSLLNEFTLHISNRHFTLIEVDKDSIESVFYSLRENYNPVFLNPNNGILEQYVFNSNTPLIVKPLISEAPLQSISNINTITIEKILVDLCCDEDLFPFYQGSEKKRIFNEAYAKYTVNNNKLLRYASRRGRKEEIEQLIDQIKID